MNRLFRQDWLIAWNTIRATFASWHDRAITTIVLVTALAVLHAWFSDRSWMIATWATLFAGTMIGLAAGRLVATRLAFHAFDGLVAADALHPQMRRHYIAIWHGIGLALLIPVTLIARPSLLIVSVPAYLCGALAAGLADRFAMSKRISSITRPGRTLRVWSQRPIAGVAVATTLLLALLPARTLSANALVAIVGIGTVLAAMMLTTIDDTVVRFMTIVGHGSRRIIGRHIRGLASFLAVAVPGCWVILGPVAAGIVACTGVAMLLLLTLRILAYRLHAKQFANCLVSILTGLLMLVAYSMPLALPVIAFAILWQLQRRARAKTWVVV